MSAVIGIDVSLTSTGLATVYDNASGHAILSTIATVGKRDDTLADRAKRIEDITDRVMTHLQDAEYVAGIALIVIEAPAAATRPGGSTWDRAGLWWSITAICLKRASVAVVSPSTRTKWATGSGRADKAAVAAAMTRRAPNIWLGNSDEADALALAWMGAQHLGWRTTTAAERDSLRVIKWPDLASDE